MIDEKIQNLLAVMGLLLVIVANASPAVANQAGFTLVLSPDITMQVQSCSDLLKVADFSDSRFIEIGKELSEPPVTIINAITIKQLPAIPATFLMVLTGFLCVSFVKDRKIWLTIVFGVLYLVAAGFDIVPQLLANCNEIKVKQSSTKETACELRDFVRPASDAQVTRYVGLLRRMAIPGDESVVVIQGGKSITAHRHNSNLLPVLFLRSVPSCLYSCFSAIIKSHYSSQFSLTCLAIRTQNWFCPSQVFAPFTGLAHGPP